jgi:hypothetical protein
MGTIAARTELESQQLKFEPPGKVMVAFLEVRPRGREEGSALHGCSPSLALRSSAEPVCWSVEAPASLAPPTVNRSANSCARYERREVKVSTVSATKGWRRIGRSNTMQQAQNPERSSEQA